MTIIYHIPPPPNEKLMYYNTVNYSVCNIYSVVIQFLGIQALHNAIVRIAMSFVSVPNF